MSNTPEEQRNVGDRQIEASISTNSPDILSNQGGKESNSSPDVLVGLSSQKPWRGKRFRSDRAFKMSSKRWQSQLGTSTSQSRASGNSEENTSRSAQENSTVTTTSEGVEDSLLLPHDPLTTSDLESEFDVSTNI